MVKVKEVVHIPDEQEDKLYFRYLEVYEDKAVDDDNGYSDVGDDDDNDGFDVQYWMGVLHHKNWRF